MWFGVIQHANLETRLSEKTRPKLQTTGDRWPPWHEQKRREEHALKQTQARRWKQNADRNALALANRG
jgi:hypothetical protein